MENRKETETIESKYMEMFGRPGCPAYTEPDPVEGRRKLDRMIEYVMGQPEYTGHGVVVCQSIHDMVLEAGKRGEDPRTMPRTGAPVATAIRFVSDLTDMGDDPTYGGVDAGALSCGFACLEGKKDIYFVQLPIAHYCEERDGGIVEHRVDGPALEFADGTGLYSIDDFRCPQWVVCGKPGGVTARDILSIEDTDVRRIAIRKFGLLPLLGEAEEIDGWHGYRLLDLGRQMMLDRAMYLSMVDPSTGETYACGVSKDCDSVQSALDFRAWGEEWRPTHIDGVEQGYSGIDGQTQQGDVMIQRLTPEEFMAGIKGKERITGRAFVLSPDNQKHHVLEGTEFEMYGDDTEQFVRNGVGLVHPTHHRVALPEYCRLRAVLEYDPVSEMARATKD